MADLPASAQEGNYDVKVVAIKKDGSREEVDAPSDRGDLRVQVGVLSDHRPVHEVQGNEEHKHGEGEGQRGLDALARPAAGEGRPRLPTGWRARKLEARALEEVGPATIVAC